MSSLRSSLLVALPLLLLLVPLTSRAAVCTFDSVPSIDWAGITDAAQLDCVTSGGSDDFVVPAGTTVNATGPILWSTTTPGTGGGRLTVQPGGTFACLRANGCTELALDHRLICEFGSTCKIQGQYPELGVASPGLVETAAEQSVFPAGDVVPCPGWDADDGPGNAGRWEPDCDGLLVDPGDTAGTRNEMALVYSHAEWGGFFPTETLDNLLPGDVLLWKDDDLSTSEGTPVDEGFAYEIVLVDSDFASLGTTGVIVLDVRQTDPAAARVDAHYPDVLRQVETGTLNATLPATGEGSRGRVLDTQTTVLPGTTEWLTFPVAGWKREERVGMYVRFDCAGDGVACDQVFRISRTWDDAPDQLAPVNCAAGDENCDLLELYSPFGLPYEVLAGTQFWIDYGWRRGDTFSVYRPVRVHAAGAPQAVARNTDGLLLIGGVAPATPHEFRAIVYEDGNFRFSLAADGTGAVMEDFWFRDPYHGGEATLIAAAETQNWVWKRVHRSGGAVGEDGIDHGFTWGQTGSLNGWVLEEWGWRHGGDDWISGSGLIGGTPSDMTARRIRFQYASNGSSSQQYTSSNGRVFNLTIEDGECVQCATPRTATLGTVDGRYEGLLFIHPGSVGGACTSIEDLLSLGTGLGGAPKCPIDRFVFAQTDVYSNVGGIRGLFHAATAVDAQDGLIRDFRYERGVYEAHNTDAASLENILVLDYEIAVKNLSPEDHQHTFATDCSAENCYQLQFNTGGATPATSIDLDRITVAFRDDSLIGTDWAYRLNQTDVPNIHTLEGLLAYMPPGAPTLGRGEMAVFNGNDSEITAGFANTTRGPCVGTGYSTITSNGNEHLLPPSTVLGVPLDLTDPSNEQYGAVPGGAADAAGCGIRGGAFAPGLFRWRPMNYWMGGVPPENASGSTFPMPDAEATEVVPSWPGLVSVSALGGPSVAGGLEAAFFSPQGGDMDVTLYAPSGSTDLLALLGPVSLRPHLASEPVRVWDFSFTSSPPHQITFGYESDELLGAIKDARLAIYGLRSDGRWIELPSAVDGGTETIVASTLGFTRFVLALRAANVPALSPLAWILLAGALVFASAASLRRAVDTKAASA